jgi:hypothetical protein
MCDVSTLYVNRENFHFVMIPCKIYVQDEGLACAPHFTDLTLTVKLIES